MRPSGKHAKNAQYQFAFIWQDYLVAMAMSLDKLENKVKVHYLHLERFHMVKRLRKLF